MNRVTNVFLVVLLTAAFTAGLLYTAWWIVPALAALYGLLRRTRKAPREAMLAALAATVILIAQHAFSPLFPRLLEHLGRIFPVPGAVVILLAAVVAMVLAYTSARSVTGIVGVRD